MSDLLAVLDALASDVQPVVAPEEKARRDLLLLSDEDKARRAMEWKFQGIPVPSIAKAFGVDIRTIYRWLNKAKLLFRETFEEETAADLLSEHLLFLDHVEELCLYEAGQLGKDGKEFDPKTGTVVDKKGDGGKSVKLRFIDGAVRARKMKIDLMMQTGMIPSEPHRMYHSLKDEGQVGEGPKTSGLERTREELVRDLLDKLGQTPVL